MLQAHAVSCCTLAGAGLARQPADEYSLPELPEVEAGCQPFENVGSRISLISNLDEAALASPIRLIVFSVTMSHARCARRPNMPAFSARELLPQRLLSLGRVMPEEHNSGLLPRQGLQP